MNIFFISYCDDTTVRFKKLVQYLNDGWYQLVSVYFQSRIGTRGGYSTCSITGTGTRSRYSTAQSQGPVQEVGTVPLNHRPEKRSVQ